MTVALVLLSAAFAMEAAVDSRGELRIQKDFKKAMREEASTTPFCQAVGPTVSTSGDPFERVGCGACMKACAGADDRPIFFEHIHSGGTEEAAIAEFQHEDSIAAYIPGISSLTACVEKCDTVTGCAGVSWNNDNVNAENEQCMFTKQIPMGSACTNGAGLGASSVQCSDNNGASDNDIADECHKHVCYKARSAEHIDMRLLGPGACGHESPSGAQAPGSSMVPLQHRDANGHYHPAGYRVPFAAYGIDVKSGEKLTAERKKCKEACMAHDTCESAAFGLRQKCDDGGMGFNCQDSEWYCGLYTNQANQARTSQEDSQVKVDGCGDYCDGAEDPTDPMTCQQCKPSPENTRCYVKHGREIDATAGKAITYHGPGICLDYTQNTLVEYATEPFETDEQCYDHCADSPLCIAGTWAKSHDAQFHSFCSLYKLKEGDADLQPVEQHVAIQSDILSLLRSRHVWCPPTAGTCDIGDTCVSKCACDSSTMPHFMEAGGDTGNSALCCADCKAAMDAYVTYHQVAGGEEVAKFNNQCFSFHQA